MIRPTVFALCLAAAPLAAQEVRDCDTPAANARNLARPFDEATREFANGEVALIYLLQEEPACCGAHLMVTYLSNEEPFPFCRIVTSEDGMGWSTLDLPRAKAAYDPATGLTVTLPGTRFGHAAFVPFVLRVTVNRASGQVSAEAR